LLWNPTSSTRFQFPRPYSLLHPAAKTSGLLAAAKAKNIATLSAAPFGGAILATGSGGDPLYTFAPALPEVVEAVQRMERRCAELGVSIAVAGQIDPALSGGPDFVAAGQPSVARAASNCRRAGA
jgi:hypothetical protein